MTLLSCHRFRSNEVRLWLSLIAYNLGNLWRRLVLPKRIENWSLTSLQQRLVKTGGRLIKHARCCWLLLPEGHLSRRLFGKHAEADRGAAPAGRLVIRERGKSSAEKSSRGTGVSGEAGRRRETDQGGQRNGENEPRCDPWAAMSI